MIVLSFYAENGYSVAVVSKKTIVRVISRMVRVISFGVLRRCAFFIIAIIRFRNVSSGLTLYLIIS